MQSDGGRKLKVFIPQFKEFEMYFAEFYQRLSNGLISEACGDRSVLVLDGRESADKHHSHAIEWARTHKFVGYKLCKGASFTDVQRRTGYHGVRQHA